MSFVDYDSTKDYREHLARALELGRQQLNSSDFDTFFPGLQREIERLDAELAEYHDLLFLGNAANGWTSFCMKAVPTLGTAPYSIHFNSPSNLAPWTGQSPMSYFSLPADCNAFAARAGTF